MPLEFKPASLCHTLLTSCYNTGKEVSELPDRGKTETKSHHPHDKGYRQLLANKKTFLELLQTFVGAGWVREIDEGDLTLVDKSYVLQDFSDKEADIVYRLRLRGTEVIFYVLLELQSTVDQTMPFRLLQYMVEVWRDVYKNTPEKERARKGFRLPSIVPAVLYNGKKGWTARRGFREYQWGTGCSPGCWTSPTSSST
jgi:Putative transposase, YhgA-like.